MNYDTDYYNSPLIQFFKSGHTSLCQSTAYKSYNKCDRLATVANCVLPHTHHSFKNWLLMEGIKKGIHHILKWSPSASMPRRVGYSQGFVRITKPIYKIVPVLLSLEIIGWWFHSQKLVKSVSRCIVYKMHTAYKSWSSPWFKTALQSQDEIKSLPQHLNLSPNFF